MSDSLTRRLLALGLALALPAAAYAQAPAKHAKHEAAKHEAAAKPAAKEAKAKPALAGEWAIMASELNLSEDQKAQLAAKVQDRDTKMKAWDAEHGTKLAEAKAAAKAAREAKDKDKAAAANKEVESLTEGQAKVKTEADAAIHAILTPAQAKTWEGFTLSRTTLGSLSKAKLTDAQKAEIRARAQKASDSVAGNDPKARMAAARALRDSVVAEVLTAEQRAEIAPAAKHAADAAPAATQKAK